MSSRRSQFKKGIDADACRRGRRDTTIQLRKGKKEDQMQKRRMGMAESNLKSDTMHKNEDMPTSAISSLSSSKAQVTVADLPRIMPIISNPASTNETLVPAIADLRRILSVERNPPVNEVIDAGAVPHLVRIMATKHDCWEAVFEAAWAITNIGSTDRTAELVHCDAVQPLILLLKHNMPEIREQAAWALGNIAGDCPEFRDMVINGGALDGLILNVNEPANMSLLGNVVWTLSNLCRGKPATALEQIQCVVAPLANLFSKPVSEDVLADVAWALSYVSDGNDDRINLVVQSGVIQPFVQCLATASTGLLTPVLRTLGNCVTGNDVQTQAVIDAGVLGCMQPILESQKVRTPAFVS
jgi:importin subunit alpha-6/7